MITNFIWWIEHSFISTPKEYRENAGVSKLYLHIICEKREAILVKGISYPVQTYEVVSLIDQDARKASSIEKTMPGLSLSFDPSALEDNETAIKLVADVMKRLTTPKWHKCSLIE